LILWLLGVVLVSYVAATAFAETTEARYFVMRDGRRVPLTRSKTEYGVTFHTLRDAQSGVARERSIAGGKIEDYDGDRDTRVKILRVPETNEATRAMIAADPSVESVYPAYRFKDATEPVIATGALLVRVKPELTDAQREALWTEYGVTVNRRQPGQAETYVVEPVDGDDILAAEKLASDSRTVWAQPDFRYPIERRQIFPSDQYFSLQWHLEKIEAPEAWVTANGQDILIGMFDDGCDVDHPDLRDGYLGIGHDPSFPTNDPGSEDPRPKQPFDNHGTRVMGLAIARGNTIGGRGVAYQARFTASRGLNSGLTASETALAYVFARQQNVDVHINSWGLDPGIPNPAAVEDQIEICFNSGRDLGDQNGDGEPDRRGMVILFASGDMDVRNEAGFDLSTLPWVISVGASHDADGRAGYSNYGDTLNFLAPSGYQRPHKDVFTTDNRDTDAIGDWGANKAGFNVELLTTETDKTGNYTEFFSGTSASCPIAAGVAALVLSVNPLLDANDVRIIMEHTSDQIDPANAAYNGITSRSLKYGYGRINARRAVDEAVRTRRFDISENATWPDPPADVVVKANRIEWRQNTGTDEFLILQSDSAFNFIPEDGKCYDDRQVGCASAPIASLPPDVSVLGVGCELTCDNVNAQCALAADKCTDFLIPTGKKYFGLYARTLTGRYSFGVAADSDGNVTNSGIVTSDPFGGAGSSTGGSTGGDSNTGTGPAVTIRAVPLEGESPLSVQFQGNAVSAVAIDESATAWDFDTADGVIIDARSRTVVHTYTVPTGQTRSFKARLTMCDVDGSCDSDTVTIRARGPQSDASSGTDGNATFRIKIGTVANPGADITKGTSPVAVLMSIDAAALDGTLTSVSWDLGDGAKAASLSVPHNYINQTGRTQRVVITAVVETQSKFGTVTKSKATRFLTIEPGAATTDQSTPHLPGAGASGGTGGIASPCGATGMIPLLGVVVTLLSMMLVRKKYRVRS